MFYFISIHLFFINPFHFISKEGKNVFCVKCNYNNKRNSMMKTDSNTNNNNKINNSNNNNDNNKSIKSI